jgi:hypothetical protein
MHDLKFALRQLLKQLLELHSAGLRTIAKTSLCRARSRATIKFRLRSLRARRMIPFEFCFRLVEQRAQRRTRTRIPYEALPRGIAIQFRQQGGQTCGEFFSFRGRKLLNGCLDFLHGAHVGKLPGCGRCDKPIPFLTPPIPYPGYATVAAHGRRRIYPNDFHASSPNLNESALNQRALL